MSRSYREPWYVDGYGSRNRKAAAKRFANKRVRHAKDMPSGKAYRKFYNPWDISDWKFEWDPKPHIMHIFGETRVRFPDPEWKVRRK